MSSSSIPPNTPDWKNITSEQDITLDDDSTAKLDLGKGTLKLTKDDGTSISYNITIGDTHVKGSDLSNAENLKKVKDIFNLIIKDSTTHPVSTSGYSFTTDLRSGDISKLELSNEDTVTETVKPSTATAGKVSDFATKVFIKDATKNSFEFNQGKSTLSSPPPVILPQKKKPLPSKPPLVPTINRPNVLSTQDQDLNILPMQLSSNATFNSLPLPKLRSSAATRLGSKDDHVNRHTNYGVRRDPNSSYDDSQYRSSLDSEDYEDYLNFRYMNIYGSNDSD